MAQIKKIGWVKLGLTAGLVLAVAAVLWLFWPSRALSPLPPSAALLEAAEGLDTITIDASFEPEAHRLTAVQTLEVCNREEKNLDSLVLRTYANAFRAEETSPAATEELFDSCYPEGFSAGGMEVVQLAVNGEAMVPVYLDEAQTVLSVQLQEGWQPGQWLTVTLEYTLNIPDARHRFGRSEDVWMLGNVFPQPSVYEQGAWRQEPYVSIGDPFVSHCANYEVTLRLPQGYQPAASGYAWEEAGVYRYEASAVRDFALVILKGGALETDQVGQTVVAALGQTREQARKMLKFASQALTCYNKQYGLYPYPSLTAVTVDMPFGGMEYPGLMMISREVHDTEDDSLEITVAHETAHQWWYAVVGSDQYYEAWQDEALAEYSLLDYVSYYYGEGARERLAFDRFETAMRVTVPQGVTPGSPIDYFGELPEYTLVTYRRGAALMVALENALGRESFRQALAGYYEANAFELANRRAFMDALKAVSGSDWAALLQDYLDTYIVN